MKKLIRRACAALAVVMCAACGASGEGAKLTADMYARATAYAPANLTRLASALRKAQAGGEVTLGVIGGSITYGDSATNKANSYARRVLKWWQTAYPQATIKLVNAGVGATDSYLGAHRVERDLLSARPDVVIVEFSVNDQNTRFYQKSYDNLVRRILEYETMPAVMLLFMTMDDGTSAQEMHANIGFRYKLPMISYRNAVLPEIENGSFGWKDISPDNIHPNDDGHALAAEMITTYLEEVRQALPELDAPPAPFDMPFATRDAYMNAKLLYACELTPDARESFELSSGFYVFESGWHGIDGEISFTVEAKNIGALYKRTTDGKSCAYDAYIDGERAATLNADFAGGWGDYAHAQEIYASDAPATHTILLRPQPGARGEITLLGLLIS